MVGPPDSLPRKSGAGTGRVRGVWPAVDGARFEIEGAGCANLRRGVQVARDGALVDRRPPLLPRRYLTSTAAPAKATSYLRLFDPDYQTASLKTALGWQLRDLDAQLRRRRARAPG